MVDKFVSSAVVLGPSGASRHRCVMDLGIAKGAGARKTASSKYWSDGFTYYVQ